MYDLESRLADLGLSEYLQSFLDEGFDSWDILLDITESDLEALGLKLGHRRKLQRAIFQYKLEPNTHKSTGYSHKETYTGSQSSDWPSGSDAVLESELPREPASPVPRKRKYQRHAIPDKNAPERPPSAYVIFSNKVRDDLKGDRLSFAEIAKTSGKRWQRLSPGERQSFELQGTAARDKYLKELAFYKTTPEYAQYQDYLTDFKARYGLDIHNQAIITDSEKGEDRNRKRSNPMSQPSASENFNEPVVWTPRRDEATSIISSLHSPPPIPKGSLSLAAILSPPTVQTRQRATENPERTGQQLSLPSLSPSPQLDRTQFDRAVKFPPFPALDQSTFIPYRLPTQRISYERTKSSSFASRNDQSTSGCLMHSETASSSGASSEPVYSRFGAPFCRPAPQLKRPQ